MNERVEMQVRAMVNWSGSGEPVDPKPRFPLSFLTRSVDTLIGMRSLFELSRVNRTSYTDT